MSIETWKNYKKKKHSHPSPLRGIRVLELCTVLPGPAGPGFLAAMGAEVIKCELPPMGDTCRNLVPYGSLFREQGLAFVHANANKYWVGLDLHKTEGQKVFQELAAKSDIIEENQRPGVMESWNIGYRQIREINPAIIYISKTGFGQWGQYAEENRPSNDGASQAFSGYAWLSSFPGRPPLKSRLYVCDNYGALMGELAVLAALHHRKDRQGAVHRTITDRKHYEANVLGMALPANYRQGSHASWQYGCIDLSSEYILLCGWDVCGDRSTISRGVQRFMHCYGQARIGG